MDQYGGDHSCDCAACKDWRTSGGNSACRTFPRNSDTCDDPWGLGCTCNDGADIECEGCWLYGK